MPHYLLLVHGSKAGEAKLGLANAYLWMARPDLSLPLYNELRAAYPEEQTGVEGLLFARRQLRARTTLGATYNHDNTPMSRHEPFVSHTWRAANNTLIFGLAASGGRDFDDQTRLPRREYEVNLESLSTWLEPRLSISRQTEPRERTFGDLRLQVNDLPMYVNIGRINWGKSAFTIPALDQGLTANRFGVEGKYQFAIGELRGFANYFSISDGNRINAGDLRVTSRWRPWGRELKPFYGVQWRFSNHIDPDYWSPKTYALGYVGLEGEWERRMWMINAIVQAGVKLAGEASTSVAGSLVAKRWIGEDWAIGMTGYAQSGSRASKYQAAGVTAFIEKLW